MSMRKSQQKIERERGKGVSGLQLTEPKLGQREKRSLGLQHANIGL